MAPAPRPAPYPRACAVQHPRRGRSLSSMRTRRLGLALASAGALFGLAALAWPAAQEQFVYNHTPSVPVGFYVRTDARIERGAFVTVRARDVAPLAAAARDFAGLRNRFIKRVAAMQGDEVCAEGDHITINNGPAFVRRTHDSAGAPLARWHGCRILAAHEILLLGDTEDSFDGRYWGPVHQRTIEGVWRPL